MAVKRGKTKIKQKNGPQKKFGFRDTSTELLAFVSIYIVL